CAEAEPRHEAIATTDVNNLNTWRAFNASLPKLRPGAASARDCVDPGTHDQMRDLALRYIKTGHRVLSLDATQSTGQCRCEVRSDRAKQPPQCVRHCDFH